MINKTLLAGCAVAAFGIGIGVEVVRDPAPQMTELDPELVKLLDPAIVGQSLCGKQGQDRGLFFKPAFQLALAPKAQAAVSDEAQEDDVPLWPGLGGRRLTVTTNSDEAQAYFDQGFALVYGFNHWEAARAFKKAQALDPTCAACYWGEALIHGPNINAPMGEAAVEPAFAALSKAMALAPGASAKEQALIGALAKRYSPDPKADRGALDQAYADAMAAVHDQYPDDQDIASLYAEALMDTSPWDYWERDFKTPHAHIKRAIDVMEGVLSANPDHPGSIHLYIHLMEASVMPERAETHADRLASLMPGAGHLVHMPGHIYFRIGRYLDSLETNIKAIEVDEDYLAKTKGSDLYRYGYYPHNVHFVLVSAQMAGNEARALEYARKLDALIPMEALAAGALVQPIKVAPYFAYLQFGTAGDIAALAEPPADYPYVKGIWHYVRGVSAARSGDVAAAAVEADAIRALNVAKTLAPLTGEGIPADEVLTLAELVVRAQIARTQGDLSEAAAGLREAASVQKGLAYTEPPYWYYPVEQTLGAVLLQTGDADEAVTAFQNALIQHPNNAWSLYGLLQAQEKAGDEAAPYTKALLDKAAADMGELALDRL